MNPGEPNENESLSPRSRYRFRARSRVCAGRRGQADAGSGGDAQGGRDGGAERTVARTDPDSRGAGRHAAGEPDQAPQSLWICRRRQMVPAPNSVQGKDNKVEATKTE